MDTSTISSKVIYDDNGEFIEAIEMTWQGESDFIKFSGELAKNNIFHPMTEVTIGKRLLFGPYDLLLVSVHKEESILLFKLVNKSKKTGTYVGSIDNEWRWELKENK